MSNLDKIIFPNGEKDRELYRVLKEKYNYTPPKPYIQRKFKKSNGYFKSKK